MIKGGPKIINDSLVLCLDAHDAKSYAGEPTTNNLDSSNRANANTGPNVSNNFASIAMTKGVVNYSSDRPHVYSFKSTNAIGYVSIGYNSSIQNQSGSVYAFSFDYKVIRADSGTTTNLNTAGITVYGNGYKNPTSATTASNISSSEVELHDGWKRVTKTYTCGYTGYNQTRQDLSTGDAGDFEVLIDNIQFEDKTYSTPFANLSRSATDGWKDLSTNDHDGSLINGTVTGATHYRDGQVIMPLTSAYLDFDGSDDHVKIDHSTQLNNAKTWEIWINIDSFPAISTSDSVFSKTANWNNFGGILLSMIYGHLRFSYGGYWADVSIEQLSNMSTNTWYQVVGTGQFLGAGSGVLMKGYLNGVYKNSLTRTEAFVPTNTNALYLGDGNGGTMNGKIGLFRVYEDILTDVEILSNYNATKNRFT